MRSSAHLSVAVGIVLAGGLAAQCAAAPETLTDPASNAWSPVVGDPGLVVRGDGFGVCRQASISDAALDYANDIVATADGGALIVGRTTSAGAGGLDAFAIKLDAAWTLEWARTYGGAGEDYAFGARRADGGYAISGFTNSAGAGEDDAWLLMIDEDGAVVTDATFGGAFVDRAYPMAERPGGGFLLPGERYASESDSAAYLVAVDATGGLDWEATFDGDQIERAFAAAVAHDRILVAGTTADSGSGSSATHIDGFAVMTDMSGAEVWRETYARDGLDIFHHAAALGDGFVLTGYRQIGERGENALWALVIGADGSLRDEHTFGSGATNHNIVARPTPDGGVAMVGYARPSMTEPWDAQFALLDADGAPVAEFLLHGDGGDGFNSVVPLGDDRFLVTGYTATSPDDLNVLVAEVARSCDSTANEDG